MTTLFGYGSENFFSSNINNNDQVLKGSGSFKDGKLDKNTLGGKDDLKVNG